MSEETKRQRQMFHIEPGSVSSEPVSSETRRLVQRNRAKHAADAAAIELWARWGFTSGSVESQPSDWIDDWSNKRSDDKGTDLLSDNDRDMVDWESEDSPR